MPLSKSVRVSKKSQRGGSLASDAVTGGLTDASFARMTNVLPPTAPVLAPAPASAHTPAPAPASHSAHSAHSAHASVYQAGGAIANRSVFDLVSQFRTLQLGGKPRSPKKVSSPALSPISIRSNNSNSSSENIFNLAKTRKTRKSAKPPKSSQKK
jgi:hypothetical protein